MVTIYAIEIRTTGEAYIGCTAGKIGKRMREHRCLLKAGRHTSPLFQRAHDMHGPDQLVIRPLETLERDATVIQKREKELYWLKEYEAKGLLLNSSHLPFQPPVGASAKAASARKANGYKPSPETNMKRRIAQLGRSKGHGAKISATKQAKNRT